MASKVILRWVAAVVFIGLLSITLTSCGSAKEKIIGRWQSTSTGEIVEFFDDNKVIIEAGFMPSTGTYNVTDDGRLRMDSSLLGMNFSQTYELNFHDDVLEIRKGDGSSLSLKRIK